MYAYQRARRGAKLTMIISVLWFWMGMTGPGSAVAGGLMVYEFGTAEVGLASAGYNVRAQDASTVFTNPAGMTRLDGTQFLASGQIDYANLNFSIAPGTSPALGVEDGGRAFGSDGWFLGGGGFFSYSLSRDLKLGFAMTGNFGAPLEYDNNWAGRYYVQEATMIGMSFVPAMAYRVTENLSLGLSVTAMYGKYTNQVAINNVAPGFGDGQLKLDDNTWGWGVNLGLLYEFTPGTRIGLTWNSQVNLDFSAPAEFTGLAPGLATLLNNRGLLNASIDVGIKVPQQAMGSIFHQVNDRWALLGSVGWQQWSQFGQLELGIDDTTNPTSTTKSIDFRNTWHFAGGAQYRISDPWLLNFGMAYDTGPQSGGNVSPLLPVGWQWRFGTGVQQQMSKTFFWGIAGEYMYGGTLDTNLQSTLAVAAGGRGNLVGSYDELSTFFLGLYGNWTF